MASILIGDSSTEMFENVFFMWCRDMFGPPKHSFPAPLAGTTWPGTSHARHQRQVTTQGQAQPGLGGHASWPLCSRWNVGNSRTKDCLIIHIIYIYWFDRFEKHTKVIYIYMYTLIYVYRVLKKKRVQDALDKSHFAWVILSVCYVQDCNAVC